jgi:hypothetical protein
VDHAPNLAEPGESDKRSGIAETITMQSEFNAKAQGGGSRNQKEQPRMDTNRGRI